MFLIYLAALGVVSAFAINQLITIPLVCATIMLLASVSLSINRRILRDFIFIQILFSMPQVFGAIFGYRFFTETSFNHVVSYFATPLLFYLIPRLYIEKFGNDKSPWLWLFRGWWLFLLFLLLEFVLVNVFQVNIDEYIYRPLSDVYDPLVFGVVIRGRSFAEESAHSALYLGAIYFVLKGLNLPGKLSLIVFLIGLTLMFGIASWMAMFAIMLALVVTGRLHFKWSAMLTVAVTLVLIFYISTYFEISLWLELIGKFSSTSFDDRNDRLLDSILLIQSGTVFNLFFGMGPGYYKGANVQSVVGLPFLTFFQSGIFGLILLASMFLIYIKRAWKKNYWYACAIIYSVICYGSISNYWLPWIWLIFAIVDSNNFRVIPRQRHLSENIL